MFELIPVAAVIFVIWTTIWVVGRIASRDLAAVQKQLDSAEKDFIESYPQESVDEFDRLRKKALLLKERVNQLSGVNAGPNFLDEYWLELQARAHCRRPSMADKLREAPKREES